MKKCFYGYHLYYGSSLFEQDFLLVSSLLHCKMLSLFPDLICSVYI